MEVLLKIDYESGASCNAALAAAFDEAERHEAFLALPSTAPYEDARIRAFSDFHPEWSGPGGMSCYGNMLVSERTGGRTIEVGFKGARHALNSKGASNVCANIFRALLGDIPVEELDVMYQSSSSDAPWYQCGVKPRKKLETYEDKVHTIRR